jgi:UrcA family protein
MRSLLGKSVIAMTLTTALLGTAGQAFAGETSKTVSYTDLNLNIHDDVAVLYQRIQDAARVVCKDDSAAWYPNPRSTKHFSQCMQVTIDKAVRNVNNFELTALHKRIREEIAGR